MKRVTFCGHRDIEQDNKTKIRELVYIEAERLIQRGAEEFLLGGYGGFDNLCAAVVRELKLKYPSIISTLVIPYMDRKYDENLYDGSLYPPIETVPKRLAIVKRNEYMVNVSDAVIVYVNHSYGGAANTFEYANRMKKEIIKIVVL